MQISQVHMECLFQKKFGTPSWSHPTNSSKTYPQNWAQVRRTKTKGHPAHDARHIIKTGHTLTRQRQRSLLDKIKANSGLWNVSDVRTNNRLPVFMKLQNGKLWRYIPYNPYIPYIPHIPCQGKLEVDCQFLWCCKMENWGNILGKGFGRLPFEGFPWWP